MLGSPNGSRIALRQAATRAEILGAAWTLAGEVGLAGITLREVARRVGMQAPSLYSHFASKHAIYDAMFGQAWIEYEEHVAEQLRDVPADARAAVHQLARTFFDFAVADLARYQLMNQRIIPGFEPSPESYAPAVRVLDDGMAFMAARGIRDQADMYIFMAVVGGLIDQQHANDPGGDRFSRVLPRAIDMWADGVGLPATTRRSRTKQERPT